MATTIADHDDTIREMAKNRTAKEIAEEIGYSHTYVCDYCKKNDIHTVNGHQGKLDNRLKEIKELAKTMTALEIANEMGTSAPTVYSFCESHNIEPRPAASIRDKKDEIIELAKTKTVTEIAEKIGYSRIYIPQYT